MTCFLTVTVPTNTAPTRWAQPTTPRSVGKPLSLRGCRKRHRSLPFDPPLPKPPRCARRRFSPGGRGTFATPSAGERLFVPMGTFGLRVSGLVLYGFRTALPWPRSHRVSGCRTVRCLHHPPGYTAVWPGV